MRCIPLNTNKYMYFSILIKKEIKEQSEQQKIKEQSEQQEIKEQSGQKNKKKVITYNLKFIDSARHKKERYLP